MVNLTHLIIYKPLAKTGVPSYYHKTIEAVINTHALQFSSVKLDKLPLQSLVI